MKNSMSFSFFKSLILVLGLVVSLGAQAQTTPKLEDLNWVRLEVQKVDLLKSMYIPGVDFLFIRMNNENFVPPVQYTKKPLRKDLETDTKHNVREILSQIAEEGKLPSYVKPIHNVAGSVEIKGKKYKSHFIEYQYRGENISYMSCFMAVQINKTVHTFFTSANKGGFNTCRKEMQSVVLELQP